MTRHSLATDDARALDAHAPYYALPPSEVEDEDGLSVYGKDRYGRVVVAAVAPTPEGARTIAAALNAALGVRP